ncbi:3'(2'),5'-bisphosphate nucleotidase CysQ [Acetobacteraceae bacterium H6797]|nr:3'(2'),5'-bisphosphate nucleotidase CysQ [Acetobacteraceae bacterium H6797]
MNDRALLDLAAALSEKASAAIMTIRAAGFAVERKSDESPVTEADRVAEALITEGLRAATPDIPVVAEEEVAAGMNTAPGPRFWLVDPLDGTREFAAGREEFTVNIGLIVDGRPHLGACAIPATGEIFLGIMGDGAWKQWKGERKPIAVRQPPAEGITVMASRHYADDPRLTPFLEGRKVAKVINAGSALKFCRLAEGAADLYPRFGTTMEWDTAAPQAVLEAAGGTVRNFDGSLLRYAKPGWANEPFIATGAVR